jgi:Type ISP C-terminal specificity domain/N-6 DNA Methylase
MSIADALITFAAAVRADRAANPAGAGDGTGLELLIAPKFQALVQTLVAEVSPAPLRILPEYQKAGLGRPDIAFALPASPARAFIELKAPDKGIEQHQLRGHDLGQFKRFGELPLWALTNFTAIKLFARDKLADQAEVLPPAALDPATPTARAETLIRQHNSDGFLRIIKTLAMAEAPSPKDAAAVAAVLAQAARLVREVVLANCREGLTEAVGLVRADFNETLFARAEAGGHDVRDMDQLFSTAFAQTLVFGLLLARDAGDGAAVDHEAYRNLPEDTYPLLRGTLRALSMDEVRDMLGVSFGIVLDAVNSIAPELLVPRNGRDPMLYLYEDFLRVFDPEAVAKYGVYYTPPEIVKLMVAETDRALRDQLGTDGLLDRDVRLLDPACGTGTFLIGAADAAADAAEAQFGAGMIGPEMSAFAQRMYGFELLVGPYAVAHYRMAREILNRGGGVSHIPIYLTDTLAPPAGAAGVNTHLAMLGAPLVKEREAADRVKQSEPILAVIGNPPYKRLKKGEVERLVGRTMNERWEDLKRPVQAAGFGRSLNAFPDLCIAFYRWALWRLFEADGAQGRGTLTYITNRTFLTATGYGGLRQMLRDRFDTIRIIDFRGENRGALPATVDSDANVFQIEVGVCILIASAKGTKPAGQQAEVSYADVWTEKAFSRRDKLTLAQEAAVDPARLHFQKVDGNAMARLKPSGFTDRDWPSLPEVFTYKSNGMVTYRDGFSYATTREVLKARLQNWHKLEPKEAAKEFKETRDRKSGPAYATPFNEAAIEQTAYRPLDCRHLYNLRPFIDFPKTELQTIWGQSNTALMALAVGTGSGPAIWSHGLKPDQHAFRGSYGGWVFPLHNPAEAGAHFVDVGVLAGLTAAYGGAVEPQSVYDAVLALLSSTSYTTRFAHDLEDDFPNIPFPAEGALFTKVAAIGARIRAVQGLVEKTGAPFRKAKLEGDAIGKTLDVPTPARAWAGDDGSGAVSLVADGSFRMTGVSERVWKFNVSGYPLLYKWLKARSGESLHGDSGATLLRQALDVAWRIEELLALYDSADELLSATLDKSMTRMELNLDPRDVTQLEMEGDDAG